MHVRRHERKSAICHFIHLRVIHRVKSDTVVSSSTFTNPPPSSTVPFVETSTPFSSTVGEVIAVSLMIKLIVDLLFVVVGLLLVGFCSSG